MAARAVDVEIRGKNTTGKAFKDAAGEVDSFAKRVTGLINPMNVLKGVIAGLGIASLGAVFKKATAAAIEHETSLGRNAAQLTRLGAAWDFVLVKLGQAILGMDQTGGFTDRATAALASMGQWIEQNKGTFQEFAGILLTIAKAVSGISAREFTRSIDSRFASMMDRVMGRSAVADVGPPTSAKGSRAGTFETFLRERDQAAARKLAEEESKRAAKDAADKAKREQQRIQDEFNSKILPQLGGSSTRPGILSTGVGTLGATPTLSAIGDPRALDVGTKSINKMQMAVGDLRDSISGGAKSAILDFAATWEEVSDLMVNGSMKLGRAIELAGKKAVGGVLLAKGRETILDAAKAAVQGFTNPAEFAKAAKLFAIGTAQMAAGQLFAGGGGGGGGASAGLGAGGFADQQRETSDGRGEGVIIIKGGILDTGNPDQMDALATAFEELRMSRRIVITGG